MDCRSEYIELNYRMKRLAIVAACLLCIVHCAFCLPPQGRGRELVLRAQHLRNHTPGPHIVPHLRAIVDSLSAEGHDDYYFAAVNVLIDQLFSDGRFAEADAEAANMEKTAIEAGHTAGRAMSHRVRGQMLYKLMQSDRALAELDSAVLFIPHVKESSNAFATMTSIQEWRWIVASRLGDRAAATDAARNYVDAVDMWRDRVSQDPSGHFLATALALEASVELYRDDYAATAALLDSAASFVRPDVPSRAYEHLYEVRSRYNTALGQYDKALADVDTLLKDHTDFPWFYLNDLLSRARILNLAGRHEESLADYDSYVAMRDSITSDQIDRRLDDLSTLYRSEVERQHHLVSTFRLLGVGGVALLLLVLLIVSMRAQRVQRRQNRLLVERLRELDRQTVAPVVPAADTPPAMPSEIERLDQYMRDEQPFTDAALSRRELAAWLGTTPEGVARLIRTERDMTVLAYINAARLDEARRVLESDSQETLTEIASRLGFGTLRTFQRSFSERYSMPPSRYRAIAHESRPVENN